MPTPSRSYSPSAAERLRLALLALAATAATTGCDRCETALGIRTEGVLEPQVPETANPAPSEEPDGILLGGESPVEPASTEPPDSAPNSSLVPPSSNLQPPTSNL